jgi:hypothetical protein
LRLANVQVADAGLYSVLVANGLGSTPSASATLVVLADAPAIVRQPVDQTALVGSTATFTVEVAGAGLISYQWRRNGTNLPGATGGSLSLSFLQLIDSGTYDVVVSNSFGARVSTGAVLSVVDALAPVISAQPSGQTVKSGAVAELSVTASGTPPLVYWWARNGVVIPGATSSVLRLPAVTLGDSGVYTASVANRAGTAVSVPARVTVTSPPVIVKQPLSQAVSASESLTLAVQVAGTAPFRYQWRKEGIALPGATNASLLIARTTVTEAGGYSVLVSNDEGSVTSATATVQVIEPGFGASHVVVGSGYVPAGQIVVRSTLHFTGVPAAIGWQVLLPSGWSYVRDEGVPAPSKPTAGQQDLLEWSWPSPPASPITLEYTLRVPAGEAGAKQVVALMTIRGSDASSLAVLAKPDPLVVERSRTGTHSADSNQDGRISLLELTRVIELYNTRTGSVRTGEYRAQEGTEDGFAGGP